VRRTPPTQPPPRDFEIEAIEIETTDGRRPSSTAADRLMVGLAALALVGGALIAVTNVLSGRTTQTRADASPEATGGWTPPPPPPLRTVAVAAQDLPSPDPEPGPDLWEGWVRALEKMPLWSHPRSGAPRVGSLQAGEAAYVNQRGEPNDGASAWLQISGQAAWFQSEVAGRLVVRRYDEYRGPEESSGSIYTLVAGGSGFFATGWSPEAAGNGGNNQFASTDGETWRALPPHPGSGFYEVGVAEGPAGWLMVDVAEGRFGSSMPWVWRSPDLHSWQPLGAIGGLGEGGVMQLVGSESGYVMTTSEEGLTAVWYSADGLQWSERRMPMFLVDRGNTLTATPLGFYLQAGNGSAWQAAFSPDGWTWTEVADPGMNGMISLAAAGDELVAIDRSDAGEARAWIGTIRGVDLTWQEDPTGNGAFDGAVLTTIVSDGQRPIAFGWEPGTDLPLWWTRYGVGWQRHQLPLGFVGIPRVAAGGPAGYVLLGSRPSVAGSNPLIWHLTPDDTWEPEQTPVIDFVADPPPDECGRPPSDVVEVLNSDLRWLAYCIGDTPLTFQAWSANCDGCYGQPPGTYEPAWLAGPTENILYLSPIASGDWGWIEAVLPPSLERDPRWQDHWVEVTGHLDDPAAADCRWVPDTSDENWSADDYWYESVRDFIDQCRGRFVITAVTLVRGP
jgi:hypothetical protein